MVMITPATAARKATSSKWVMMSGLGLVRSTIFHPPGTRFHRQPIRRGGPPQRPNGSTRGQEREVMARIGGQQQHVKGEVPGSRYPHMDRSEKNAFMMSTVTE